MFLVRLKLIFISVTFLALIILSYLWYKDYNFDNSPLSSEIKSKINTKKNELKFLTIKEFGINSNIPIIISNKMPSTIYGMATVNQANKIVIYLNKQRFKESSKYMIEDVLPHEYAHALMFVFKDFSEENGGHTIRWENICKKLNGIRCNRFVDNHDIITEKTKFLYDW